MYHVDIKESGHDFEKKNLVTLSGRKGNYDEVVCKNCKIKGRRYGFTHVQVAETYDKKKAYNCSGRKEPEIPNKIRITRCYAHGKMFANLTSGSEHEIVDPPSPEKNDHKGVWVMGVGEPVKVLNDEFERIN